jgi:putative transposase
MVEEGMYLARCMRYIDLNMIRAGVVDDPRAWKWTGYAELMGEKKRNRLIDFSEVLRRSGHSQRESFQIYYAAGLAELIEQRNARQAEWTECLAVGSKNYVEYIESRLTERSRFVRQVSVFDATRWTLKEPIFGYRAASRG